MPWKIVDQRTEERVTIVSFFSEDQAWEQIALWEERHKRGGRPDVTREKLFNMRPRLE